MKYLTLAFLIPLTLIESCNEGSQQAEIRVVEKTEDTIVYGSSNLKLDSMDPLQFLESLKIKYGKNRIVMLQPYIKDEKRREELVWRDKVPENWIRLEHIDKLMNLLDDTSLTVPVFSVYADLVPTPEPNTTIGIEAMRLVEGYKSQMYPSLWPRFYAQDTVSNNYRKAKRELIDWWKYESPKK